MKLNQYENLDLRTLTDQIIAVSGNIENAFRQMGIESDSYTQLDIVNLAMPVVLKRFSGHELILEDLKADSTNPDAKDLYSNLKDGIAAWYEKLDSNATFTTSDIYERIGLHSAYITRELETKLAETLKQLGAKYDGVKYSK
jgi:hypothetical protein